MSEDVWQAGDAALGDLDGPIDLGAPSFDEGWPVAQAFWIPVLFSGGMALLKEQPSYVLTAAALIWMPSAVITVVNAVIGYGQGVFDPSTGAATDAETLTFLIASFAILLGIVVVFGLLSLFLQAGAYVGAVNYIRNDVVSYPVLLTSFRPALRFILYFVLLVFMSGAVMIVTLVPGSLLFIGSIAALFTAGEGPGLGLGLLCGSGLFLLVGAAGLVLLSMKMHIGTYAAILDEGPIQSITTSWANTDLRAMLSLFIAVFLYGVISASLGGLISGLGAIHPLAQLGGLLMFALPQIALIGVWISGTAVSYVLCSRARSETDHYAFFQRNPPGVPETM